MDKPKLTQEQVWATEIACYACALLVLIMFALDYFLE